MFRFVSTVLVLVVTVVWSGCSSDIADAADDQKATSLTDHNGSESPKGAELDDNQGQSPAMDGEVLVVPFVNDLQSSVGDLVPSVTIRFESVWPEDRTKWASMMEKDFQILDSSGEPVPTVNTLTQTDSEGFKYGLGVVPTDDLASNEWYELRFEPTGDSELVRLMKIYSGDPDTGVISKRFMIGPSATVRQIKVAEGNLHLLFSEDLFSAGDEINIEVDQGEESLAKCTSLVSKDHWVDHGSNRIDTSCSNIDITQRLTVQIHGYLFTNDGAAHLAPEGEALSITIEPNEWRPCHDGQGCAGLWVPGY